VLLLVLLLAFGKRVSYEQSIRSFFAPDDPIVIAYGEAAKAFGDDNFVFVVYDDPALLTPRGWIGWPSWPGRVGPGRVPGVLRVESLDAMPLLWKVDDALLALDRLPGLRAHHGDEREQAEPQEPRPQVERADRRGRDPLGRSGGPGRAEGASDGTPALPGDADRRVGHLGGRRGPTEEDGRAQRHRTIAALREQADAFAAGHGLPRPAVVGPPVLLADGFSSIERDGRRLAVVGMLLIGLVTLSATRSLWWALVPILAGWVVWLATEALLASTNLRLSLSGGPLVAQIIVLTMPAASHLAIHFRDDRRRQADPRVAARTTLSTVTAPILWCAVTGAIGYGALYISRVVPVQQFGVILGGCTLLTALLVLAISPAAMLPPFRLEVPVRFGSTSRAGAAMNGSSAGSPGTRWPSSSAASPWSCPMTWGCPGSPTSPII
jgi:hypothetical protein